MCWADHCVVVTVNALLPVTVNALLPVADLVQNLAVIIHEGRNLE